MHIIVTCWLDFSPIILRSIVLHNMSPVYSDATTFTSRLTVRPSVCLPVYPIRVCDFHGLRFTFSSFLLGVLTVVEHWVGFHFSVSPVSYACMYECSHFPDKKKQLKLSRPNLVVYLLLFGDYSQFGDPYISVHFRRSKVLKVTGSAGHNSTLCCTEARLNKFKFTQWMCNDLDREDRMTSIRVGKHLGVPSS